MLFKIHTYGCQMNVRDSDAAAATLVSAGHVLTNNEAEADLVVVNTCSVRGKAEDKALGKLGLLCAAKRDHPGLLVGVMGCMAQRLGEDLFKRFPTLDLAVGTRCASALPRLLERVLQGERGVSAFSGLESVPDVVEAHHETACSAFVTILLGCERRCAYCIVPDVRGEEFSRPVREIVAEVRILAERGVREITLLGQSVLNYGLKQVVLASGDPVSQHGFVEPFPRLLEAVASVPGVERIRFTSSHVSGCTDELVRAMATLPQLCHHIHLPCQSGSDRILAAMRRGYTRRQYLESVEQLRLAMPDLALTTDVIVGFPGETEAEFEETRSLLEEARVDNTFIFKYSTRPGTPAALLEDDVAVAEKERRNQVLLADQDRRGVALNQSLIGSIQEVLAEGASLRNAQRWSGRTPGNKIVVFKPHQGLEVGCLVRVRITRAAPQTLYGEIVA